MAQSCECTDLKERIQDDTTNIYKLVQLNMGQFRRILSVNYETNPLKRVY